MTVRIFSLFIILLCLSGNARQIRFRSLCIFSGNSVPVAVKKISPATEEAITSTPAFTTCRLSEQLLPLLPENSDDWQKTVRRKIAVQLKHPNDMTTPDTVVSAHIRILQKPEPTTIIRI